MPQKKIPENTLTPQQRNELVEAHINVARFFAYKLCKDPQLIEDCIQEGVLGLIRAARLFDESRHKKFITFANFEVQCSIRDFLFRNRMIRLPDDQRTQINKYQTTIREMELSDIDITSDILVSTANEIGLSKEVHNQLLNPVASLNAKSNSYDADYVTELGDSIPNLVYEDPVEKIAYEECIEFMRNFFASAKITDEKTRRIVIAQMNQFIKKSLGDEIESLTALVAAEYPELDTKSKEFDRQYTRISGVWRTQFNKFKKALASRIAFV